MKAEVGGWVGGYIITVGSCCDNAFPSPETKSTGTDFSARGVFSCNASSFIGILIGSNHTTECKTPASRTKYITVSSRAVPRQVLELLYFSPSSPHPFHSFYCFMKEKGEMPRCKFSIYFYDNLLH